MRLRRRGSCLLFAALVLGGNGVAWAEEATGGDASLPAAPAVVLPSTAGDAAVTDETPAPLPLLARPWSERRLPAPGPAHAIGSTSNGCLQGAVALPARGPGFESMRRARHRFFGHPDLVAFIGRLGAVAKTQRLGVVRIGDLSQPRGGPAPSGHRSHQTGLDVDVGFVPLRRGQRASAGGPGAPGAVDFPAVVDLRSHALTAAWEPRTVRLLAAAAADPAIDRIFVNPAVRRALCAGPERQAPWFGRLRPWWGHHDHFHVRLKCPADNALCQPQEPVPAEADQGCGDALAWWFKPENAVPPPTPKTAPPGGRPPPMPPACGVVLTAADDGRAPPQRPPVAPAPLPRAGARRR